MGFQVTSLQGQTLVEKFPRAGRLRNYYLPIVPNDPHPDHGMLLTLANAGEELEKPSYVKADPREIHTVPWGMLRPLRRSPHGLTLSKKSYFEVIRHCAFEDTTALSSKLPEDMALLREPPSPTLAQEIKVVPYHERATASVDLPSPQPSPYHDFPESPANRPPLFEPIPDPAGGRLRARQPAVHISSRTNNHPVLPGNYPEQSGTTYPLTSAPRLSQSRASVPAWDVEAAAAHSYRSSATTRPGSPEPDSRYSPFQKTVAVLISVVVLGFIVYLGVEVSK